MSSMQKKITQYYLKIKMEKISHGTAFAPKPPS